MRFCTVDGETFAFHGFFQFSHAHEGSLSIGGFPPGVEAEDGMVRCVRANKVKFEEVTEV